jgi:hypothetical protein
VIPSSIPTTKITPSGYVLNRRTNTITQTVTITNILSGAITGPIYLAVDDLSSNTSLANKSGNTVNNAPIGSPYIVAAPTGLAVGASVTVTLQFTVPASGGISENLRVITANGQP